MISVNRLTVLCLIATMLSVGLAFAQQKKTPGPLAFETKQGKVTFNHATHVKAAKNDCKVCHDKLFAQDAKAPLNFKAGVHRPAEAKAISCGACHRPGGTSFESKGNCVKCHVKAAAKKG